MPFPALDGTVDNNELSCLKFMFKFIFLLCIINQTISQKTSILNVLLMYRMTQKSDLAESVIEK